MRRTRSCPDRPVRLLNRALAVVLLLGGPAAPGGEPALPDPLALDQALQLADAHPGLADPAQADRNRRPEPLFMGCHSLAFAGARRGDGQRDQAWSPLVAPRVGQRLQVVQCFFDVLLADLSYTRANEAMAVAYVQFDRASVRAQLGQFSPLQVAELEAAYQRIRRERAAGEAAQRLTRALLVQAIGGADRLPRELIVPELQAPADRARPPADLDALVRQALRDNAWLDRLADDADDAGRRLLRLELRTQLLELLTRLELLAVVAEQARSESDWRDLKLDESRTLYELEAAADLGFAMSQQTRARRDQVKVRYCQALTRAELVALLGRPVAPPFELGPALTGP